MKINEKQFEQIVTGLNIDDRPNAEHKKALRQQMLAAYDVSSSDKTTRRIQPVWSRIMKSRAAQGAIAAMLIIGVLTGIYQLTGSIDGASIVYAQVVKAMRKAQTIHVTGYRLYDEKMLKSSEIWYRQNTGYKVFSRHKKNPAYTIIDNGQYSWKYQEGQNFAVRSNSITTENLPKELTEMHRYLEKCTKDKDRIEIISGVPCQLYMGSYSDQPDRSRVTYWVDENLWPRRFEEKVQENDVWKTTELVEIEYDLDIDTSVFKPDFGMNVEIIDEGKILDNHFSLENTIFTKEEMGLIFAVHEVKRCENGLIFTVTSLRPTQKTYNEIGQRANLVWDYGGYQLGSAYEYLADKDISTSYIPIKLAWFYQNGLLVRWTVFIPHGFESGQVEQCKLELYYLYTCGKLKETRKEAGLPDKKRINPIAVLPLPEKSLSLQGQLNKTYDLIKLLEPMRAEKHLTLKSIPFTDKEMEDYINQYPDSGETKKYREGDRDDSVRLHHGQSKKPSQISFEGWLEDRTEEIEKYQNQ